MGLQSIKSVHLLVLRVETLIYGGECSVMWSWSEAFLGFTVGFGVRRPMPVRREMLVMCTPRHFLHKRLLYLTSNSLGFQAQFVYQNFKFLAVQMAVNVSLPPARLQFPPLTLSQNNLCCLLYGPGKARFEHREVPPIEDPHDILVRISYVGVCGKRCEFHIFGVTTRC
jgi:Threonine dehydrogenase and related Zn-dependent dehydrogenases